MLEDEHRVLYVRAKTTNRSTSQPCDYFRVEILLS